MESLENRLSIFAKREQASPDYFTGTTWLNMLVPADEIFHTSIVSVKFEAGSRNNWHTHPGGQILIGIEGTGYFQEKGKPIQLMHTGDVIKILPGVEHWHGASPGSAFTHIAVNTNTQKGMVNWMERVTDEEYDNFN
jgi:quercetin dioxygenase-like cupin family protein